MHATLQLATAQSPTASPTGSCLVPCSECGSSNFIIYCQNQTFLIPLLSSPSYCLSAGLAFTPAPCPTGPLWLSQCPSFRYNPSPLASTAVDIWATPATWSHQAPLPPTPLKNFRLRVPESCVFYFVPPITAWPQLWGLPTPRQVRRQVEGGVVPWSLVSCTNEPCALNTLVFPGYPLPTVPPNRGDQSEITDLFSVRSY